MKRQFLCDTHSLMSAGFLMYLFMNDFFTWMFDVRCCCNLMMFYEWRECVMNVLGTIQQLY